MFAHTNVGEITVEAFTCLLIFKNVFSFGLTFGAYDWIVSAGILKVFYIIASVQVGICLLSIPMCRFLSRIKTLVDGSDNNMADILLDIFGKRNRAYFAHHNLLGATHLW